MFFIKEICEDTLTKYCIEVLGIIELSLSSEEIMGVYNGQEDSGE